MYSLEEKPDISIVIPVFNAEKTLSDCLDSLSNLTFPAHQREIIVVDNNSTDQTRAIIKKYPVRYLFEPKKGRGWARNKGIQNARAPYVAFIDADCIAERDWLTRLFNVIKQDKNIAICGGEIFAYRQETVFEKYMEERKILKQNIGIQNEYSDAGDLPRVVTANALCRKEVIEQIGYFDEDLVTSEDTELSWRICFSGYCIQYVPEAKVYHQHIRTFKKFCRQHFEYGWAAGVINRKYNILGHAFGSPSWALASFFSALRALFMYNIFVLRSRLSGEEKRKIVFLFIDLVRIFSYSTGMFLSALKAIIQRKEYVPKEFVIDNYYKKFVISDNGHFKWLFECRASWFLHNNLIKLAVFDDGLNIYNFNQSATRIWRSLVRTKDIKETAREVSTHYCCPIDSIFEDIEAFLGMLHYENIIKKIN